MQKLADECRLLCDEEGTEKHLKQLVKIKRKDHHQWYLLAGLYSRQNKP